MNKRYLVAAMAAIVMSGCIFAHEGRKEQKNYFQGVKRQFSDSIARFKSCMKGKCTRSQAIKMVRDVTIATATIVAVIYGTRLSLRKIRDSLQFRQGPDKYLNKNFRERNGDGDLWKVTCIDRLGKSIYVNAAKLNQETGEVFYLPSVRMSLEDLLRKYELLQ